MRGRRGDGFWDACFKNKVYSTQFRMSSIEVQTSLWGGDTALTNSYHQLPLKLVSA